jgi:Nucleotide-diphospho-sugar transferase
MKAMVPTVITGATEGYARMTANAYRQFLRFGIMLRVYCLDEGAHSALEALRVPSVLLSHAATAPDQLIYGTPEFKEASMRKLDALADALRTNSVVVWVDGDVVPLRDPCAALAQIAERMQADNVDLAMQCDEPWPGGCMGAGQCWMCSGIMVLRRTPNVVTMVAEPPPVTSFPPPWHGDQDYINWFARMSEMRVAVLPRPLFPNGVFVDAVPPEAILLHYNYLKGADKERRMREAGHWVVDD